MQYPGKITKFVLAFLLALVPLFVHAQQNNTWLAFFNKDSSLIGFKDLNGKVKILPKYPIGFTIAKKFDKIIAMEIIINDTMKSAYLLKNLRTIGKDSVYYFDNTPDCESEGFIRFKDYKNDKVGMFDGKGQVVIPAKYNELLPAHNGLIMALEGAEKKYWEGSDHEHYSWVGGHQVLLDIHGKVLIDYFNYHENLCLNSLMISSEPIQDSTRENFKSIEGNFYSFINFEKEFKQWLFGNFLQEVSRNQMVNYMFENITYWSEVDGWKSTPNKLFMRSNFETLQSSFNELKEPHCNFQIMMEDLNPFIFESKLYEMYFDNCGNALSWKYPVMNVIISSQMNKELVQDSFEFLRTTKGYKLIGVSMRSKKLM